MGEFRKVVLAYSGGLDTSVMLRWIGERYRCPVVAYAADVGQGQEELAGLEEKARRTGAEETFVLDLKEEFARDFIIPLLRAGATYEGGYLLGTAIARPLIAKGQVEVARRAGADALAHGATGKGNDQVRFELTYAALAPDLKVLAPWREWDFGGREHLIAYADRHGIPVPATRERPYSTDRNLLHMSFEGGTLEDPWREPPSDLFVLTRAPEEAPDEPRYIEVHFEEGDPVGVDDERLSPASLLARLNAVGGEHGAGRVDMVENRFVGMKCRGVYEAPGGTLLHVARRAVESITLDREVMHLRDSLLPRYAAMVYNGFWFSPEREFLQGAVDEAARAVSGTARLKLYKGSVTVVGRSSPRSLYRADFATFGEDEVYRQKDAEGFIRLNALRLRIRALQGLPPKP
ncbi:MAG: argininosuccinate synthase [Nitrospinota bacterium]